MTQFKVEVIFLTAVEFSKYEQKRTGLEGAHI